jgi:hypothetical protein
MSPRRHPGASRDPREPLVAHVDPGVRRDDMVVELRQYTLHPGRRDTLIELFEREFIETQEAAGITLLGTFRDLDDADRFVWLRGFADMRSRADALQRFYGGPAWRAHRDAANATMIDSDDVLLLRPVKLLPRNARTPRQATVVAAVIPSRGTPFESALAAFEAVGARTLAAFETDPSPNDFPQLPVREGISVLVVLASPPVGDASATKLQQVLRARLPRDSQVLRLAPTARSSFPA